MPSGSCLGWDIGPTVGALTLRAIPGFPVTWVLGPVEGYVPADPVFEVRLSDWTVLSFPAPGGAVALTAEQTAPLRHASSARLIDSGQVIAAGPFRVMKSWSGDCAPVTAPVRIVVGPQGDQGNPGIDAAPPEFAVAAVPLPPHTAPTATIAGDYASAQAFLEAHRASKEAEINASGQPPLKVALGTAVGAYHAAVSDDLIKSAVQAVLNPAG